jgi:hypothetical protein
VAEPGFVSQITLPPILNSGGAVEAERGVDASESACLELADLFLFLRLRKPLMADVLIRSPTRKDSLSLALWEVNARDRVLGRKKPSLPKGMLRPWTT